MHARCFTQEIGRHAPTASTSTARRLADAGAMAESTWLLVALTVALLGACSGGDDPGDGGSGTDGQNADVGAGDVGGDGGAGGAGGGGGGGSSDGATIDGGGGGGADGGGGGGGADGGGGGADGGGGSDGGGGGGSDGGASDGGGGGGSDGGASDGGGGSGGGGSDGGASTDSDGGAATDGGGSGGGGDGGPVGATACVVDTAKGIEADACPAGQICKVGAGVCKGMLVGECVAKGALCPAVVAPVCDCSGKTWNNLCEAQNAGAIVASGGACGGGGGAPKVCGGKDAIACAVGEICDVGCGEAASGVCIPTPPETCPPVSAPQCGCDGNTWPNACARHHAGVALKHDGACKTGPTEVACKLGPVKPVLCQEGYYCMIDELNSCAGKGHCKPMPIACTKELKKVCGCDQTTYDNPCLLAKAGWSQASADPCP